MASSLSGCRHSPQYPFSGMRRLGLDADDPGTLVFACEHCGVEHRAPRCVATNMHGTRCRLAALTRRDTCRNHRLAEGQR